MNTDRELLAESAPAARTAPVVDDAVPLLAFLAGTGRAVAALVRFCLEVSRDGSADPIDLTPRILRQS